MKTKLLLLFAIVALAATITVACNKSSDTAAASTGSTTTVSDTVTASTSCDAQAGFAKLLCLCESFKASLTSTQLSALQLTYSFSNIKTWSNLPAAMSSRLGIRMGDLTTTQLSLAKAIVKEMSGTTANEGYDEVQQLWAADNYLAANGGGSTYGSGNYYLAFFGTPASTGTFEIMMTGHHKTVANTYTNGAMVAATPHFAAVEPLSFTSGTSTYAPIDQEKDAFAAILSGLSTTQLASAKSGSTFSDLLLGPSANWSFPTTSSGLVCSGLSTAQKQLVINAIKTYVYDVDDTDAATILTTYTNELDKTYILYSGTTAMTTKNDYFRIDGPHVWIEFSVQNGVILSGVHYHSVWRDRITDYAGTH